MEKLNIAELLKDCPSGMELDCTLIEGLEFDGIVDNEYLPIRCRVKNPNGGYNVYNFTKYGCWLDTTYAKCVIFPKGKTTWDGFQRPFKDGDILYAIDEGDEYIFILDMIDTEGRVYCYLNLREDKLRIQNVWLTDINESHRLATEEEKEKLFDAIKANGYKWNEETKTLEKLVEPKFKVGDRIKQKGDYISGSIALIDSENFYKVEYDKGEVSYVNVVEQDNWELVPNKFDITILKPFDKVLVRDNDESVWFPALYGNIRIMGGKTYYMTVNGHYKQCIPYKGNEYLLGETIKCIDYYKTWD